MTSNISFDGVMPDKSAPGMESDCNPISIDLGSPDDMSPLGGNKGSKYIGEPLVPGTRVVASHHTCKSLMGEFDVH
jgi:hypothetical protein